MMNRDSVPAQAPVTDCSGRYENWLSVFDALGVQFLVLDANRDNRLLQLVQTHPSWTVDLYDGESVLFTRTGTLIDAGAVVQLAECQRSSTHGYRPGGVC